MGILRKQQPTVAELLDEYKRDFILRGCRSIYSLKSEIRRLKGYLGKLTADEVDPMILRRYRERRREDGMSAATINKEMAILKAAFNVAAAHELIPTVPVFPRRLTPARPRQGFFEWKDYLAVREELPDWAKDVLTFGMYSGWRKGEVLGLTWGEVDLEARLIRLDPKRSKNGDGRPPLPLAGFGLDAMERRAAARVTEGPVIVPAGWRPKNRRGPIEPRTGSVELVFHRDGKPICDTWFHTVWKAATTRAGVPNLLYHDLRRTCVRALELAGVSRIVAMGWVGHKTEAMYRRYFITREADLITAANKLIGSVAEEAGRSAHRSPDANPANPAPHGLTRRSSVERVSACSPRRWRWR